MYMMLFSTLLFLLSLATTAISELPPCSCGYRMLDTSEYFTHALYSDFRTYSPAKHLNRNSPRFANDWITQSYISNPRSYDPLQSAFSEDNVWIEDGLLKLRQVGYSTEDAAVKKVVSGASIVSRVDRMYRGSFRATMRITDVNGGSVAAWYWYQSDATEIDIEVLTIEPNLVHYTIHPSLDETQNVIPTATSKQALLAPWTEMQEYRFDWNTTHIQFYQNGRIVRTTDYRVPTVPGSMHLSLWATGSPWTGFPSSTDVVLEVESLVVFYNTTDEGTGESGECGPSETLGTTTTICNETDAEVRDVDERLSNGVREEQGEEKDVLMLVVVLLVVIVFAMD